MSIPYKVKEIIKPGEAAGGEKKYYATVVTNNKTDLNGLIKKVEKKSSIFGADLIRVVYILQEVIAEEIEAGNIVHLGPLGSFYPAIKSEAKDSPKAVKSSSIKKVSINYRPSRELKERIAGAKFEKRKS